MSTDASRDRDEIVEVMARGLLRRELARRDAAIGRGSSVPDVLLFWDTYAPEARDVLSALEAKGYVVMTREQFDDAISDAYPSAREWERDNTKA